MPSFGAKSNDGANTTIIWGVRHVIIDVVTTKCRQSMVWTYGYAFLIMAKAFKHC